MQKKKLIRKTNIIRSHRVMMIMDCKRKLFEVKNYDEDEKFIKRNRKLFRHTHSIQNKKKKVILYKKNYEKL